MTESTPSTNLGRRVFGMAGFASGLITLVWHDYNDWHQVRYVVYAAAAAQIFGGAAIQFWRSAKTGAAVLGAAYLVVVVLCLPGIVTAPRIYNSWGNFFEQFSLLTGAGIVYARFSSTWTPEALNRIGRARCYREESGNICWRRATVRCQTALRQRWAEENRRLSRQCRGESAPHWWSGRWRP